MHWPSICSNSKLPWIEKNLLEHWKEFISWRGIAANNLLFKDPNFFEKNLVKWLTEPDNPFYCLSYNELLRWSNNFIERFADYWDWESLSINPALPWSIKFIEQFSDQFIWGGITIEEENNYIEGNMSVGHLQYCKVFNNGLVINEGLPWSIDFLIYFENKLDFEMLSLNTSVWEKAFKPYVDENVIEKVLRIL